MVAGGASPDRAMADERVQSALREITVKVQQLEHSTQSSLTELQRSVDPPSRRRLWLSPGQLSASNVMLPTARPCL